MAMIGIQEMNLTALDDAEMIHAFAVDDDYMRDSVPANSITRSSFEVVSVMAHADAVNLPGVRLVRL